VPVEAKVAAILLPICPDLPIPIKITLPVQFNLVLAGLRLGLKNHQVGEKWVFDDCSYLCKGLHYIN
jgi:hypothetical protein